MKTYIITERFGNYIADFMSQYAPYIKVTGEDRFEINPEWEGFDPLTFHGVEELNAGHDANNDVIEFLKAYVGQNDFLLSVKSQFQAGRRLSDKQIGAVRKCMQWASKPAQPSVVIAPVAQTFSIAVGEYIVVNQFIAKRIADENGLKIPHNGLEILGVHRETEKAYLVDVKLSARKSIYCSCCGRELDNAQSRARGIGPVCAEKWGFSFDSVDIEEVNKKVDFKINKVWIPKSGIKERVKA